MKSGLLLLAGMLLFLKPVWPQSTALLTGTVVDQSGAVLVGATVSCSESQTGLVHTTRTNSEGLFEFPSLPIGTYVVKVSAAGLESLVRSGLQLETGHNIDLHLQLQMGASVQSVQVTAPVPVVQSTSSEIQTTVNGTQMSQLPLNGRNALQLVTLTPGTFLTGVGTKTDQQENPVEPTTNGLRAVTNNYLLDGMPYINREWSGPPVLPNPDTLEEFTMKSANYTADLSGAGSTMMLSTRSGTDQFHGNLFEFLRNYDMDSRNFFAPNVNPYRQNQFGGTLGGPIKKDKMFIFLSYQATRQIGAASPSTITAPTAAERNGDFSADSHAIIDPTTGKPFPGNIIPSSLFNPIDVQLTQQIVPVPSNANGVVTLNSNNVTSDNQGLVRLDYQATSKDHLSGRWYADEYDFRRLTSPFPGVYAQNYYLDQSLMASDTRTFSPNLVFVGSFQWVRTAKHEDAVSPVTLQSLGAHVPLSAPGDPPSMYFMTSDYKIFSGAPLWAVPSTFGFQGATTWMHGRHMVRFGVYLERDLMPSADLAYSAGEMFFNGSRTASLTIPKSGDVLADILMGLPNEFVQDQYANQATRQTQFAPFVQDDWRVAQRLTLNLGLRWEPWLPPSDLLGPVSGWLPGVQSHVAPFAPVGTVFTGDPGLRDTIWPVDWNGLAPRVGFAWDVRGDGKTVVRSSFGLFNLPMPLELFRTSINGSAFRSANIDILNPPSVSDPYQGFAGVNPFPFSEPPESALNSYHFPSPLVAQPLDPHSKQGYVEQWNFTVERQIRADLGISISYVGNHQLDVMAVYQANPAVYAPGATEANVQERRLYPAYDTIGVTSSSWEHGSYHGLQASVTQKVSHGLSVYGNYTWSKCMDNDSGSTISSDGGGDAFNNKFNLNDGYGRCSFDVTQSVNASIVYFPRQGNKVRGTAGVLLNGWEVTSIFSAQTGMPFTISTGADRSLSGPPNSDTPDQINANASRPPGADPLREYFNTAAFLANPAGQFGDVGRDSLIAPGFWNVDMGLIKFTRIRENLKTEFRVEAFNIFNHPNFGAPVSSFSSVNFGQIQTAGNPRVLQLALKLSF